MEYITIRSLQHYLYCPHRWGLIEIDRAWAENQFIVKANIVHSRVHSGQEYRQRGKKCLTNVDVWSDTYGLIGKIDCLEEENGRLCIVEYKPAQARNNLIIRHEDAMQLFAQKVCAEERLGLAVDTAIYYSDTKKRFRIDFANDQMQFEDEMITITTAMQEYMQRGIIPPIREKQECSGCSMKDLCMPVIFKRKVSDSIRDRIQKGEWL